MVEVNEKEKIAAKLEEYCARFDSQKKAVQSLRDVAEATVINIRKTKWQSISDAMWNNIAKQIGYTSDDQFVWQYAATRDMKALEFYFSDAQKNASVFAVCGNAGTGKTAAAKLYCKNVEEAYQVGCAEYFNRKIFLSKVLESMGVENTGYTVNEMMEEIVTRMRRKKAPILILDEADKLPDQVLYFFITLFNKLEDKCALVLMATEFLQQRISRGVRLNKKGYSEIYSRIGRRFINLKGISEKDCADICQANGVVEVAHIKEVYNECEGDLRRLKRSVHKLKLKLNSNAA